MNSLVFNTDFAVLVIVTGRGVCDFINIKLALYTTKRFTFISAVNFCVVLFLS